MKFAPVMVLLLRCTCPAPVLHRIVSKSYTLKMQAFIAPLSQEPAWICIHDCVFYRALKAGRSTVFAHVLRR